MNLREAAAKAVEDSERWFPATTGNVFFTAGCLAGEVGEVLNLLKKVERGSHSVNDVWDKVVEEVADVFTYLLKLAGEFDIDLEQEYYRKQAINEDRFGQKTSNVKPMYKILKDTIDEQNTNSGQPRGFA